MFKNIESFVCIKDKVIRVRNGEFNGFKPYFILVRYVKT